MGKQRLTIIKGDVSKEARKQVKPKTVLLLNAVFEVTLEVDKSLAEKLDTDARFVSKLYDDVTRDYRDLVEETAKLWRVTEGKTAQFTPQELCVMFDADRRKLFKEYETRIVEKIDRHIKAWLQVRKDRSKYQWNVAKKIGIGVLQIGAGGGAAAGGLVSGGASWVLTIVGIAKGIAKIAKEIKRVAADVDKAQSQLRGTVRGLLASYKEKGKTSVGVAEVGKSVVAEFFVYEMKSISRAEKELLTYKGKVAPIHLNSAKLGKDLNKLLDAQTQLDRKVIKEVEKQLAKRKAKLKKLGGLQKAIDESRAMVQKLIGQLIDMNKLLESHEAFTVQVEASIVALKAKKPGWATVAEKIVWLSSIVASPTIMTIASDAENLEKLAGLIEKSFEALKDEAANRV